jgi:parvulin-like peptidyl-prolyl isomerase
MLAAIQIGDRSIPAEQLPELLTKYRLIPQIARELILEREIAAFKPTEEEHLQACKRFYQQNQLNSDAELEQWLALQRLKRDDLAGLIDRELRMQKFKTEKWQVQAESYFVQRKSQMDQVVFSMIRVKDVDMAEEIFFRLQSGEGSFVELAPKYSTGLEAKTKGISGPVELGKLDPTLGEALAASQPTEVLAPMNISGWWVVVQLEEIIPSQFDEATRQRLVEELFTIWMNEQVQQTLAPPVTPEQQLLKTA